MPGHDVVDGGGLSQKRLAYHRDHACRQQAADARTAEVFAEGARKGWALGTDFTQFGRNDHARTLQG